MRVLLVARRSARQQRIQSLNQLRHLVLTAPEPIRVRFKDRYQAGLVTEAANMRPRQGADPVAYTTNVVIRDLARRIKALNTEMRNIDRMLIVLIGDTAPSLLKLYGFGPDSAATLLVTAGDNPERLNSEQAWAHMCGVTPIPASSGKVTRYRLNRGGDRNANAALYRIVLTRMSSHDQTRQYVTRRRAEGLSTAEIMRCLKRYVARQIFKHLPQAA
jgi:transposase